MSQVLGELSASRRRHLVAAFDELVEQLGRFAELSSTKRVGELVGGHRRIGRVNAREAPRDRVGGVGATLGLVGELGRKLVEPGS